MIDPRAKPKAYLRLMAMVALMGIISAVVTFSFMALVHQGTKLVWEQTAQAVGIDPRLFTLLVCAIGGLLVGLMVKLFGDHSGIFAEVMLEFGKTGRFDYRNARDCDHCLHIAHLRGKSGRRSAAGGCLRWDRDLGFG